MGEGSLSTLEKRGRKKGTNHRLLKTVKEGGAKGRLDESGRRPKRNPGRTRTLTKGKAEQDKSPTD